VLQLVLYAIVAAGLVGGIALHVPKVRRLAAARVQPRLAPAWGNVRNLLNSPGQLARLLAGAAVTQLLLATGLWCALHAIGASASLGALIIVCPFTSLLGGIAPVPGGMGVMEASCISLLTLLGIPEDLAIAATLLCRLCTTYLPPYGAGERWCGCGVMMNYDRQVSRSRAGSRAGTPVGRDPGDPGLASGPVHLPGQVTRRA